MCRIFALFHPRLIMGKRPCNRSKRNKKHLNLTDLGHGCKKNSTIKAFKIHRKTLKNGNTWKSSTWIISVRKAGFPAPGCAGLWDLDAGKIFGLFARSTNAGGVQGLGLGLTIVKELARQHNGDV
ncbi:MAG: hypothetical protein R6U13_12185 [Desulfatiglandaceae bacterium]